MNDRPRFRSTAIALAAIALGAVVLVACSDMATSKALPAVTLVPNVDLKRFAGDWYVIANIPTSVEKGAHNAKESYTLEADGNIAIDFTFRADSFAGPAKEYTSRGFPQAPANAVWGVQFVWPFKADYRISYLADDYGTTVITREKRDYVWIMARSPTISEAEYARLVAVVGREGYDTSLLQRVPQQTTGR